MKNRWNRNDNDAIYGDVVIEKASKEYNNDFDELLEDCKVVYSNYDAVSDFLWDSIVFWVFKFCANFVFQSKCK